MPVVTVLILVYATLLPHMSSGPIWPWVREGKERACRVNWWKGLLMVNNYLTPPTTKMSVSMKLSTLFSYKLVVHAGTKADINIFS